MPAADEREFPFAPEGEECAPDADCVLDSEIREAVIDM